MSTITELYNRLVVAEGAIAALTAEVARLSNPPYHGSIMKTSVALRPAYNNNTNDYRSSRPAFQEGRYSKPYKRDEPQENPVSLSDILKANEEVTIQVNTGKDTEGNYTTTSAVAVFDGTQLTVIRCELVPSLVGTSSVKPGELLYKFINALKDANHITRTFTVPPWRLCSVTRDGNRQSLSDLRIAHLQK